MSDIDYFDEDSEPVESKPNPVRQRMKQLEREAEELRKRIAEADEAKRELAFVKAGIDPTSPMAKYFVKGYDGELTPEAIKQAAMEAQLISPPTTVVNTEADAWQRTNSVAAGSQTAQPPVDWARRLNEASSPEEVEAILAEARTQL